ncbi:MAG TPA: ABC transporter ATP-binding protein [Acidimicrobiales bacterium]|nr:ABC transporter ATP-binding protein [Acidimicrobiales bacterium]
MVDREVAISVRGLTKSYGSFVAVGGIDFEVGRGEVLALLGPNGAGKTTSVEILEGYRKRDGGEVSVLGVDPEGRPRSLRAKVGIVLQECAVDPYLTVAEAVTQRAGLYPAPRPVGEVLELVGLDEKSKSRVKVLSGGQQRRLDLGLALVGDPQVIFLDEPTTGFDPSARREAWDVVRGLCAEGRTVVLTTHYMDEAQALADTVVVIASGKVVASGSPDTLGGRDHGETTVRFTLPVGATVGDLPLPAELRPVMRGEFVVFAIAEPTAVLHALTEWAIGRGEVLDGLAVNRPSLEDVYLSLTGGADGSVGEERGDERTRNGKDRFASGEKTT